MPVTARVYAHVMALEEGERDRLRGLVEGRNWGPTGTGTPITVPAGAAAVDGAYARTRR